MSFDCISCGLCCAYSESWPVFIGDKDGQGIPEELVDSENCRMLSFGNRCAALDGQLGSQVSCSVYSMRPLVCQEFQSGSEDCKMVRRRFRPDQDWR